MTLEGGAALGLAAAPERASAEVDEEARRFATEPGPAALLLAAWLAQLADEGC
jgi:hypothetical protein